jgi:ABC-type glycerol-3-phosphate transport system permease component
MEKKRSKIINYVFLLLGLIIMTIPMIYMISSSLKPNLEVFSYPPKLLPENPTFENFTYVLKNSNFFNYLGNTIFVSLMTVLISSILASTLGYSFARLKIPGKRILFSFVIAIMLIPGLAAIIPQFELAAHFKVVNKLWGVILFYAAWVTPFSTFLIKGYIEDNIPKELDEAIYMDGGSVFTVYRHVIIPISAPSIASIGILNFLFPFEELGWSQTILKTDELRTIPVAITMFFQSHNRTDWGYVFAMTVLAMIPVILVYLLLQRYFISGLSSGAVKG